MPSSPAVDHAEFNFRILCENIQLFQSEQQLAFEGPGEIYQDKEGVLNFTIHCLSGFLSFLQNRPIFQIGGSIPTEYLYSLKATEYNEIIWTASYILPRSTHSLLDKGVICGRIHELRGCTPLSNTIGGQIVRIRTSKRLKFPSNVITETQTSIAGKTSSTSSSLEAAIIDIDDEKIQINYEQNHTVITASIPNGTYSENFYLRLSESFEFILAETISISAIEIWHQDVCEFFLRSINQEQPSSRFMPPLQYGDIDVGGSVYNLFKFFYKTIRSFNNAQPHPMSNFLRSTISSSSASLDIEVLSLSVSVEGLIQVCFPKLAPLEAEKLSQIDLAKKIIEESCLPEWLRKRVVGAITSIKHPRASDQLKEFVDHYKLDYDLYEAWRRLRNSSAHGKTISPQNVERALELKCKVTTLLYAIIFVAIGYSGSYTNYAKLGWPTESWHSSS